jgi:uncharacterized membrane protein YqiK
MILLLGLVLFFGPVAADIAGKPLSGFVTAVTMIPGILLTISGTMLLLVSKLYVKTTASRAFVRTGVGGSKVIIDAGAFVIPFMHEVIWISLETHVLKIVREGESALLTSDNILADIAAEFFIHAPKESDDVARAARSFGKGMLNDQHVHDKISEKLVGALRFAAVKRTLEELNSERLKFVKEVEEILRDDLQQNGLKLESVTISAFDQADYALLRENNILHVQGKKKTAEIVQANLTRTNQLEREGEQLRKQQDVEARKKILAYQQDQANAEAAQKAQIDTVNAQRNRQAREEEIEATRNIELKAVAKQQSVLVATQRQQQEVEVAARERQKAVEVAEQEKLEAATRAAQKVEVAEREMLQAVAEAERAVAVTETAKAKAEAEREAARQSVETVTVVQTAERLKRQEVIQAEAEGDKNLVLEKRRADAAAYTVKKDAEARKEAADADAEAVRKKAEAEKERELFRAEGLRANQMVPIEVNERQVKVDADRIQTVDVPELKAQNEYNLALKFDIQKISIEAEARVRIAAAEATASVYQRAEIKAYGTTEQLGQITAGMIKGQAWSEFVNGIVDNFEGDTASALVEGAGKVVKAARGALTRESAPTDNNVAATATQTADEAGGDAGADAS